MERDGLVEIQDTTILKAATAKAPETVVPHVALQGKAKLMRIFVGEDDKWRGKNVYDAIVESLRANDIAGATVYRGICGYGVHRRFHKDPLHASRSGDGPRVTIRRRPWSDK